MADIPDSLRLLFETSLEHDGDRYVIPVPESLVNYSRLIDEETYRIALLSAASEGSTADEKSAQVPPQNPEPSETNEKHKSSSRKPTNSPPVVEGEVRSVTIDTLGDQGDGIARVERGFIVIVSDTKPGDQVEVEITDVKETVAFAEPISDPTVR